MKKYLYATFIIFTLFFRFSALASEVPVECKTIGNQSYTQLLLSQNQLKALKSGQATLSSCGYGECDFNSDCCSGDCTFGKCRGQHGCGYGECDFNSDCCSGDCTFGKCRGQHGCGYGECDFNSDCCSGDCTFGKCRGSQVKPL